MKTLEIYFEFAKLKTTWRQEAIAGMAAGILNKNASLRIGVEGHTGDARAPAANMALSAVAASPAAPKTAASNS